MAPEFQDPKKCRKTAKMENYALSQWNRWVSTNVHLYHPHWEETMKEEYNSLMENNTWELVPLPSNRKLVICK